MNSKVKSAVDILESELIDAQKRYGAMISVKQSYEEAVKEGMDASPVSGLIPSDSSIARQEAYIHQIKEAVTILKGERE